MQASAPRRLHGEALLSPSRHGRPGSGKARRKPREAMRGPLAGHLHAICTGGVLLLSSRSALILLLFSSCFASGLRWELRRLRGSSDVPEHTIDYSELVVIQTGPRS